METADTRAELARLRWAAAALIGWLVASSCIGGFAALALLYAPYDVDSSAYQIVLCVTGGAFGASLAALLSVVTRVSRGWETTDGRLVPAHEAGLRFAGRLVPMYAVRPLFGAAAGMIGYILLLGLMLIVLSSQAELAFEPIGLLSVALLAGFFAQTFLERLRQTVETFFGRAPVAAQCLAGAAVNPAAAATRPAGRARRR
jgi:hypothetical protein